MLAGRLVSLLGLVPVSLGLCSLAGCTGLNSMVGDDPLLGGPPLRPSTPNAAPAPVQAAIPPPPAANSMLNNAALASASPRSLDNGRDLRIGAPRSLGANDGSANGNGVQLRLPEPVTGPSPRAEVATVANAGSPSETALLEQMQARGVLWQSLVMVAKGEWKYSCSIPNRQDPRLRRTYEAKAADPVAAIRAVLDQLDKEASAPAAG